MRSTLVKQKGLTRTAGGILIKLVDFMDSPEGWGRDQGRRAYSRLLEYVHSHSSTSIFRISMLGVEKMDVSYASETLVALARRLRGNKGICIVDLVDIDIRENIDAAAARMGQPLIVWSGKAGEPIGAPPSNGTREALAFALAHGEVRASEFSEAMTQISIANASSKFKQLWQQGFLLRCEGVADSGGVEYRYRAIA